MTDDIAKCDIVIYMFLNYENCINDYKGLVEAGKHLYVFGHAKEQYAKRFAVINELVNHKLLQYDNLEKECLKLIKDRPNRCTNPKGVRKVRNVIRDEVYLECAGKRLIVDIAILVAGTNVEFHSEYDRVVLDQYKDLYNKRILKLDDKVLAIETVNVTIRLNDNKEKNLNFGNHFTLCDLGMNLPKNKDVKITKKEFLRLVEPMLEDEKKFGHIVTDGVKDLEAKFRKQLDKKKKVVLQ